MKNWKKVFFTAAALVTIANAGPVFARIIPGWDRPWDPSTYWLPDTIDAADTANPSYFFRDLGWQGGNVYDHTRDIKSMLSGKQLSERLQILLTRLGLKITNMDHLTGDEWDKTYHGLGLFGQSSVEKVSQSHTVQAPNEQQVFRSHQTFRRLDRHRFDPEKQYRHLDGIYQGFLSGAKENAEDVRERMEAALDILRRAGEANGIMQSMDAQAQIKALRNAEMVRGNALQGNLASLRTIHQMAKQDKEYAAQHIQSEFFRVYVEDPDHRNPFISGQYERSHGRGFVAFAPDN